MTHDPLQQLLSRADAVAGSPARASADLAHRVRAELRRRQVRTRIAGAGVASAALLAIAVALAVHPAPPTLTTHLPTSIPTATVRHDEPNLVQLRERLAALRSESDAREATVDAVLARESEQRAIARAPQTDPLAHIAAERDLGAFALVRQADRRYRESENPNPAAAATAYARVVELFPNTHAAAVARQRLAAIGG
jgi:hypothetical protein